MGPDFQTTHASLGEEQFVVEVKAYRRSGRISVNEIQRLAALSEGTRCSRHSRHQRTADLRGQAGSGFLNGTDAQLQVLDGPALRQMLVANPDIAERHLIAPEPGAAPQ